MRLGDAFTLRVGGVNDHLHIVISDPTKNPVSVLLVSVTTFNDSKEDACLFNANEHPWILHRSCVAYDFAKVVTNEQLEQHRVAGQLKMEQPFDDLLLRRVWKGAGESARLKMAFADLLIEQGFLDI